MKNTTENTKYRLSFGFAFKWNLLGWGGSHNLNMNVILLKDTHWINFKEKLFFFIIT